MDREEDGIRPHSTRGGTGRQAGAGRSRRGLRLPAALLVATALAGCSLFSAPRYRGPAPSGAKFDGERFHNEEPTEPPDLFDLLAWFFERRPGPWPDWVEAPPGPPPPARVGRGEVRVTFVNHATTLIQIDGINILTDPVWSHLVGPVSFAGSVRVRPPGLRFEDLPKIDAVVVSHNHYDHLDLPTLRRLGAAHNPRFFVGLGNAPILHAARIANVVELDWWQTVELRDGVRITAVPAQHTSNRGLADRNRTLWAGYVIEGQGGYVYFAGDTGFGPHFARIRERFGSPRLALLPIGAFLPEWLMHPLHMSPARAVEAHRVLGAHRSVPIHFGTFQLGDEGRDEPVAELRRACERHGVPEDRFWVLDFGEGRDVPPFDGSRSEGI